VTVRSRAQARIVGKQGDLQGKKALRRKIHFSVKNPLRLLGANRKYPFTGAAEAVAGTRNGVERKLGEVRRMEILR
tara:strand:+ start:139 stop:366 length:228 start_codon:yes stop_codon:yes gene_type:complete